MDAITIVADGDASRLDKFIADNSDISRSYAVKLIEDGLVKINTDKALKK